MPFKVVLTLRKVCVLIIINTFSVKCARKLNHKIILMEGGGGVTINASGG